MNNLPSTIALNPKKIYISAIIATFNGGRYILELLESIASQTHRVDEIVVCDDCSSDDTLDILQRFKLKYYYLNIKIIKNESQLGVTKNFSKAIKLSVGDLIFLADQDDIWHNNKVETMLYAYINGNSSYIISDMNIVNMEGGVEKFTWAELMENNYGISKRNIMNGCAVVATKKFFRSCLPIPPGKGHDVWFAYCAKRLKTRLFLDRPLMNYRISPQGVSSQFLVDKLNLGKNKKEQQINNNLKTLIKSGKPLMLLRIKLLMHLHFMFVAVKFKSFTRFKLTSGGKHHGK